METWKEMKSPLVIIIELLSGVISRIIETSAFVANKFLELLYSLVFISRFGVFAFLVAVGIGAATFILITKFIFKDAKTLLAIGVAFGVCILVLLLLAMV